MVTQIYTDFSGLQRIFKCETIKSFCEKSLHFSLNRNQKIEEELKLILFAVTKMIVVEHNKITKILIYRQFQNMNCKVCLTQYSNNKDTLPRVLINCGHTLCQSCIEKSFPRSQLTCPECGQVSYGISFHQYPVNATLIALMKEEAVCKVHNQKLEAYCEKDNEFLCLSCVIGNQHKSHKISSVSEKVSRDRSILKECMKQIEQSCCQIQTVVNASQQNLQRLQNEYKDYLLQLGLCFNNIHESLKQIQQNYQQRVKGEFQTQMKYYHRVITEMKEKRQLMGQLTQMYEQVIQLPNLQYLYQDNKRLFIMENCKFKKSKIDQAKLTFNKMGVLVEINTVVQNLINFQKKLQGQSTPILKAKKSNRLKEPTILEVNLNEQYRKHFKSTLEPSSTPSSANLHNNPSVISIPKTKPGLKPDGVKSVNKSLHHQASRTPKQDKSHKKEPVSIISGTSQIHPSNQNNSNSQKNNSSFHSDCLPVSMINSFMESSQSMSIRGSEADFTIISYDQNIFHFGGYNVSSVQSWKVDDSKNNKQLANINIERSKAQCAIIPTYSQHKCLIFGGKSTADQKLDTFIEYDFTTNKWTANLFKLSEPKSGFGSTVKENKLYLAGGSNNSKSLRSFQQYRIAPNSMVKIDLANMNHCRDQLGMVLGFDGFIYACGGINESGSVLSSCQRYNESKSRWEMMPSMNKPRRSFTLASLPHGIYAIGGHDGSNYLKQVQLYDFTQEKWIFVSSMSQPRCAHTALVTSDLQSIIVSGGFHNKPLKSTEIFDIISQKWTQGAALHSERFLHCSTIVNI